MIGVACSKRSIVRPTSPIIPGNSVTTTYASSAATNSPAPARPSVSARRLNWLWSRRADDDPAVEAADRQLDRRVGPVVAERAAEHSLADEVVRSPDPHVRTHGSTRVELVDKAADLRRRVGRRDLIAVLAVDLLGRHVLGVGALGDHRGQPGGGI